MIGRCGTLCDGCASSPTGTWHGAKFAALLTVVGDLPPAWLLAASIGNVEADLRGDAVRRLQSVVPAVPVGTTDGLHPFTLRKLNLRAQFQAILETEVLCLSGHRL